MLTLNMRRCDGSLSLRTNPDKCHDLNRTQVKVVAVDWIEAKVQCLLDRMIKISHCHALDRFLIACHSNTRKKKCRRFIFFLPAVKCWPVIFVTWVAGETHFPVLTHLMHIGKPKKEAGSSEKPKLRAASVKLISGDFGDSGTHTFNSL